VVVGQRGEYQGLVQLDTVVSKIRELREEHTS
jgi:osmoprotectant transport system ATP-binding protein